MFLWLGLLFFISGTAMGYDPLSFPEEKDIAEPAAVSGLETEAPPEEAPVNEALDLTLAVREMARELVANLADPDPESGDLAEGLIVCTFVDLKKLTRTSSFGRYLAEQLMGELQKDRYTVVEIRKSNDVHIQEKYGEYGLSRNPGQIRQELSVGAMLTGTYTPAADQIIVNARIMDNRDATVLSSATRVFPRSVLSGHLLADAASARTLKKERVYLKRLEL